MQTNVGVVWTAPRKITQIKRRTAIEIIQVFKRKTPTIKNKINIGKHIRNLRNSAAWVVQVSLKQWQGQAHVSVCVCTEIVEGCPAGDLISLVMVWVGWAFFLSRLHPGFMENQINGLDSFSHPQVTLKHETCSRVCLLGSRTVLRIVSCGSFQYTFVAFLMTLLVLLAFNLKFKVKEVITLSAARLRYKF